MMFQMMMENLRGFFLLAIEEKTLSRQLRVEGKSLGNVENVWIILKTFSILLRLRCHGPIVTLVCFWI